MKRERKYRNKIIQECHYKKQEQAILDKYVRRCASKTYFELYHGIRIGKNYSFLIEISFRRMNSVFLKFGVSAREAAKAFENVSIEIRKAAEVNGN